MGKAKAKPKWTERYEAARARWEEAEAWRTRLAGLGNKAVAVLEKALEEAEKRLALGLESPLGVLQAELNLLQAELGLLQAENDLRNRLMELYQFYVLIR
mgnify:CR=1 FL=1